MQQSVSFSFFVGHLLTGNSLEIGRAAMDAVEHMAISEPLNARVLALSTVTRKDGDMRAEKWAALGVQPPVVSIHKFYHFSSPNPSLVISSTL